MLCESVDEVFDDDEFDEVFDDDEFDEDVDVVSNDFELEAVADGGVVGRLPSWGRSSSVASSLRWAILQDCQL